MPTRAVNQERLATVVGRALLDKEFAEQLHKDAEAAVKGIGVHLTATELTAVKNIDTAKLGSAGAGIRDKLGNAAIFDQQQNVQAQMD
ncbi:MULTISPECIES: Os1348 family RiPP precursor [Pseudomonas]|uniref:Os1348 family RiPP n=1 Tax=Pseudomonas cucumis TaxID=2954082 RepID=A0ABY9F4A4_9PSED|nr:MULTISPECIES: Os1348 family RiPP precursor [Pseudomonas]MDR8365101.1 Os1348 family RiPP precursor [Pseudomonas sp. JL3]URM30987.1 Os1348 family RiPP precursor [Pseudomonas frederiksbergensis]WLG87637.1 Os1348 family RiPP precursor [Pseudomonas cucumis]